MEHSFLGQCFRCAQSLAREAVCLENVDLLRHCTVRLEGLRGLSVLLRVLATATLLDGRSGGGVVLLSFASFHLSPSARCSACRTPRKASGAGGRAVVDDHALPQLLGQQPRLDVASAARGMGSRG